MCGLTPRNGFFPEPRRRVTRNIMSTLPLLSPPPMYRRYSSRLHKRIVSYCVIVRTYSYSNEPFAYVPMFYTNAAAIRVHYTVRNTTATPTTIKVRFKNNNNLLTTDMPI